MKYFCVAAVATTFMIMVAGCANLETKADALYGSFVTSEEAGAQLVQSSAVTDAQKQKIKAADAAAKPYGDALHDALIQHHKNPSDSTQLTKALNDAMAAVGTLAAETTSE